MSLATTQPEIKLHLGLMEILNAIHLGLVQRDVTQSSESTLCWYFIVLKNADTRLAGHAKKAKVLACSTDI